MKLGYRGAARCKKLKKGGFSCESHENGRQYFSQLAAFVPFYQSARSKGGA